MVTEALGDYIKNRGISITRISDATGISYNALVNCFDRKKTRVLRGDELLLVCKFLEVNPYDFLRSA